MGCACTKAGDPAGERDGLTGAVSEAVGGGVMAAAAAAVAAPRQLLEHVHDATSTFAHATVKTGELVAAATVKVASKADFMRIISKPEVPPVPPVLLRQRHRELARPDSQVLLCHRPSGLLLRLLRYKRSCPRSVCCAASAPPSCQRR